MLKLFNKTRIATENRISGFFEILLIVIAVSMFSSCGGQTSFSESRMAPYYPAPNRNSISISGLRKDFNVSYKGTSYSVKNINTGVTQYFSNIDRIRFLDQSVNLKINVESTKIYRRYLDSLLELYIAYFNRVPDADGLEYWISQINNGMSIKQISNSFYSAAIQYSKSTGYSSDMTSEDFVRIIYKNVLARYGDQAPPQGDIDYWSNQIETNKVTRAELVSTILYSAHSYKDDLKWGWVPALLENKIRIGRYYAIEQGLSFNAPEDSIIVGAKIVSMVTSTSIADAVSFIGLQPNLGVTVLPPNVWAPDANKLPLAGSYMYVEGDPNDSITSGETFLYTKSDAKFSVTVLGDVLNVEISGRENWGGSFQVTKKIGKVDRGYVGGINEYPFFTVQNGGMRWGGRGRGCEPNGWFVIDDIVIAGDVVTKLDLRFAQNCYGGKEQVRGAIHVEMDETPSKAVDPNIPSTLWQARSNEIPLSGNFVFLKSENGEYLGGGKTFLYTDLDSMLNFSTTLDAISLGIHGDELWNLRFIGGLGISKLESGFYDRAQDSNYIDPYFAFSGDGRGCGQKGWVAIDKIAFEGKNLTEIDLRFETACQPHSKKLHGQIHWRLSDKTKPLEPRLPIPTDLWRPKPGATPKSVNFVYLESEVGDFIGLGETLTYTNLDSKLTLDMSDGVLIFKILTPQSQQWTGSFQIMNSIDKIRVGFYPDLHRFPFSNPTKGGLSWTGRGHGCNKLWGWYVVDDVEYLNGTLNRIDLRFEQLCQWSSGKLHGQIHWSRQ